MVLMGFWRGLERLSVSILISRDGSKRQCQGETHFAGPTVLSLRLGGHGRPFIVSLGAPGRCPDMNLNLI